MDKPIRQMSLAHQVLEILNDRIDQGSYLPDAQLPAESALVAEFEVSRATIRRALDILESRGKVFRKQGIGSFVTAATRIANPINEPTLFQTMIKDNGCDPGVDFVTGKICLPTPKIVDALKIQEQDKVLEFHKIFTADGEPVIYLVNTIPEWIFNNENLQEIVSKPEITEPIFDFLEEVWNQKLVYFASSVRADTMGNCPCDNINNDPNELAFVFDEVGHNQDDKPILHSIHYYPGNKVKFEMIRRRAG